MDTCLQNRYKSTDFGVPPAEPDHGLNLCDHNCGHLVQWKYMMYLLETYGSRYNSVQLYRYTYLEVPLEIHALVYTQVRNCSVVHPAGVYSCAPKRSYI